MGRTADAPAYSPFGYGYTNYSRQGYCPHPLHFHDAPGILEPTPRGTVLVKTGAIRGFRLYQTPKGRGGLRLLDRRCRLNTKAFKGTHGGGQPRFMAAEDDACNALTANFFRNTTRETLNTAWLRPRYDGYMALQDRAGDILYACLRGEATEPATLAALDAAYRESRL